MLLYLRNIHTQSFSSNQKNKPIVLEYMFVSQLSRPRVEAREPFQIEERQRAEVR